MTNSLIIERNMMSRYALILGGELHNKGAQDMTFRTVAALRKHFSELEPVLLSSHDVVTRVEQLQGVVPPVDSKMLNFAVAWNGIDLLPGLPTWDTSTSRAVRQIARRALYFASQQEFERLLDQAAMCLDISGFSFSAQRGFNRCMRYLDRIETLYGRDIPTYLLPQSYGPFSFEDKKKEQEVRDRSREVLQYPRLICARERQGHDDMLELCPEARCVLAEDIVLQSAKLDLADIFLDSLGISQYPGIEGTRNVGVVPNAKTFAAGGEVEVLALWGIVVEELLALGYNVYVIRHADDDLKWCLRLKELFKDDARVTPLLENRFCFQYEELFAACDFLVASRFHSVVHSYHAGRPCIVLGWAEKYRELLGKFNQSSYCHDVRAIDDSVARNVVAAVHRMDANHEQESAAIQKCLAEIQAGPSAFDLVADDYRGLS